MPKPSVIGEGTYGCVHRPSLKCKKRDVIVDPSIVSKILKKKNAATELKEFELMEKADKKQTFYLGKPDICKPDDTESNKAALTECKKFKPSSMSKYSLLLLKYGGLDLSLYGEHVRKMNLTHINRRNIEHFWMDMSRIIYGLKVLGNNNIVHHDLKHANIVYNADSGRASFIDFGMMTTKTKIRNSALKNEYDLGIKHWSFPMELELINKKKYQMIIVDHREEQLSHFFAEIVKSFQRENRYLFNTIFENEREIKHNIKAHFKQLSQMLLELAPNNYLDFVNKSIDTIDSYGTGTGLLSVLYQSKRFMDDALFTDLKGLFMNMVHPNVFLRKSVNQLVMEYEHIMETHGLLQKYDLKFEKHMLVDDSRTKSPIVNNIDNIKGTGVYMSPTDRESFLKSIVIHCPAAKEVNPTTKRCINVCKPGYERNSSFKCRKKKTQRKHSTKCDKLCPPGKELNPHTNRCNKTCKVGYKRDDVFDCIKE